MTTSKTNGELHTDTAVVGVCSAVRGLLSEATRGEILTRHQVGEILRTVKHDPATYGSEAIERVAAELGWKARELYRYITVAETWSAADLRALLDQTSRFGHSLSWSHFLALTQAPETARAGLAAECLAYAWSVRELIRQITSVPCDKPRNSDSAKAGEEVHAALKESIQTGNRAAADLRMLVDALADRLAAMENPVDEKLLARAVQTFEDIHAQAEAGLRQLRGASQSQPRVRLSWRVGEDAAAGMLSDDGDSALEETLPSTARPDGVHPKWR
jgi:hypothetical protein